MITTTPWIIQADFPNDIHFPSTIKYDERVKPKVLQAQQFDLRQVVGKEFYAELVLTLENGNLLAGGETYLQADYDALLPYLKQYLTMASYARYLGEADEHNTRYGTVTKINPHSQILDPADRDRKIRTYRSMAASYANDICEFLSDNSSKYPVWEQNQPDSDSGKLSGVTFSSV